MTYYKILDARGRACHGGTGQWALPTRTGRPGAWMPTIANVACCERGYHVVKASALLDWLDTDDRQIWTVEIRGARDANEGKIAVASARLVRRLAWDARIARLFAADCAERVLPIYEQAYPGDARPRQAIAAARAFARGEITAAALAAAQAAARAAAAWAAAWAAARDAARDAAWDAARAAARDAAWAATGAAERRWQTRRLLAYLNGRVSA